MDTTSRILTVIWKFLKDHGLIIAGTTIAGGLALGPEAALFGGVTASLGTVATPFIQSPWWRAVTQALITFLPHIFPFLREQAERALELIQSVGRLIENALRSRQLLENSRPQIEYSRQRRDSRE